MDTVNFYILDTLIYIKNNIANSDQRVQVYIYT